jgi:hypothetical protein
MLNSKDKNYKFRWKMCGITSAVFNRWEEIDPPSGFVGSQGRRSRGEIGERRRPSTPIETVTRPDSQSPEFVNNVNTFHRQRLQSS